MPALTGFCCLVLLNCQCRLHDFACECGEGGRGLTSKASFMYTHTHRFIVLTVVSVNTALLPVSFLFSFGFCWFVCFILFLAVFHPPPQCHFK